MMVNEIDGREVMLVLQVDHSRVAGQLAASWGNKRFDAVAPYESMVLAAQEHDTGWWSWESKPTLNRDGYPLDYIGSASYLGPVWLEFYENVVERVEREDPYAGYIVSMHGDGLLTQGMGLLPGLPDLRADPQVNAFVEKQKAHREAVLPVLQESERFARYATKEQVWKNYKLMEVFDQFGQFVCNRYPLNSTSRKNGPTATLSDVPVPQRAGEKDTRLHIEVVDEQNAIVRPYPFAVDPMPITFAGRILPTKRYANRSEFLREFYTARAVVVTYYLRAATAA